MLRIRKVQVDGKDVFLSDAEFEIGREEWNEYKLLDGGKVRVKTSVQRISWIVDAEGNRQYNEEGDPHVVVRHKTDVVASE